MQSRSALEMANGRLGQRRDGALRDDKLSSWRTLTNFDIEYTDGRLKVRKGYQKFNDTELAGPPTQLYHFRPMSDPDTNHVLCIADGNWYAAKASGAHTQISDEDATAPRPVVEFGDRVFFGTDGSGSDVGFRWTDDTAIGSGTSYRVGIVRPSNPPGATLLAGEGNVTSPQFEPNQANIAGSPPPGLVINKTTHRQLAMSYIPSEDQTVRSIGMRFMPIYTLPSSGAMRAMIYSDSGGNPDAALSGDAVSDYIDMTDYTSDGTTYYTIWFTLQDAVDLDSGTQYWIVIDPDGSYIDNYNALTCYVAFAYSAGAVAGTSLVWNGAAWGNEPNGFMAAFLLGGLTPSDIYDYKLTFYNETYKSESRDSKRSVRVFPTMFENRVTISTPATLDGQVDVCRIYRRDIGTDPTLDEDEITTSFQYVGTVTAGQVFTDGIADADLGDILQTDDHDLFDETEEEGTGLRTTALQPNVMCVWKSRIWLAEADRNILYPSKVLEENGANGLIGDARPDYFPFENQLEMPVPSGIIALKPLSEDILAVYFKDESIWVIWGGNDPQNPPSDIRIDDKTPANGLLSVTALDRLEGSHIIMTRDGVYRFYPNGLLEFLSETNQSILDAIETANLENSVITIYGNEIWCLIDDDNDGDLESILILDMQRDIQTRQLMDRAWRGYDYTVNFNDIIVRKSGSTFKTLLAASADDNYILELNSGTDDDGESITATAETHDLVAPNKARIYQIDIDAKYPGTAPTYSGTLTDHNGDTQSFSLAPSSSNDIRKHRVGVRMKSPVSVRAMLQMVSEGEDELRSLVAAYAGE